MRFHKLSGAGNDFIAFDNRDGHLPPDGERPAWLRRLCQRGVGIGADGVLILEPSDRADVRLRYHNADGGEAEMCGNGLRCLVHFAHEIGALGERGTVESLAGRHSAEVLAPGRVRVSITDPENIRTDLRLQHRGEMHTAVYACPGVPHLAIELGSAEELEGLDVFTVGRALRHDPAVMPQGANVNFYVREAPDRLRMRTYERGVEAETLACGTGAVTCAVSAHLRHDGRGPVTVISQSGDPLTIHLRREGERFFDTLLEGPTSLVYTGELGPDFLPRGG